MAHQKKDFRITVEKYLKERKPNHRYTAFDYCYNHFHPKNFDSMKFDMKESCLVLYNYLANWGMLRNSFLMQANKADLAAYNKWANERTQKNDDDDKNLLRLGYLFFRWQHLVPPPDGVFYGLQVGPSVKKFRIWGGFRRSFLITRDLRRC